MLWVFFPVQCLNAIAKSYKLDISLAMVCSATTVIPWVELPMLFEDTACLLTTQK